ncbi:MAG: hypothetical protein IJD17_03120 [Clostridia bacterium]|nr:hypothetical protein [Clostridia bacterium]
MKKILALILAALMMMTVLVACGDKTENDDVNNDEVVDSNDDTAADSNDDAAENNDAAASETPAEIIVKLNEHKQPQFMIGEIPVDLADADAVLYYTGLESAEKIKEVSVFESMMGSQAFSVVVARLNDAADAEEVANGMKNGIDQRKWICVEADDLRVVAAGDLVMLVMISSEYAADVTAADYVDAFTNYVGGTLDIDLK